MYVLYWRNGQILASSWVTEYNRYAADCTWFVPGTYAEMHRDYD